MLVVCGIKSVSRAIGTPGIARTLAGGLSAKLLDRPFYFRSKSSAEHHGEDHEVVEQRNAFGGSKYDWEDPFRFKTLLTEEEVRITLDQCSLLKSSLLIFFAGFFLVLDYWSGLLRRASVFLQFYKTIHPKMSSF